MNIGDLFLRAKESRCEIDNSFASGAGLEICGNVLLLCCTLSWCGRETPLPALIALGF
jgi:hypothetical protein